MTQPVAFQVKRYKVPSAKAAQKLTIKLVAKCIRDSSSYLPIRNLAAAIATRAAPKDYLGQVREIYKDFLNRWRYVKDTYGVETLAASPRAVFHLVMGGDGRGVGGGKGAGDCDDAACAIGGLLAAIGMPVRIVTSRNPARTSGLFSHIFVQCHVPGNGWISVDPVGHPYHGFAWTPPHSAIALWDIQGQQIAGDDLLGSLGGEDDSMYYGYGQLGSSDQYRWEERPVYATGGENPLPWDVYGLAGFGSYVDSMGYIGDGRGYLIEVDDDNAVGGGYVRTPMLELAPGPYELLNKHNIVLDGTMALGDDGAVYEYDGFAGFFKKLFKKTVGKVAKKVIGGAQKLIGKTKVGRAIIKLKNRILRTGLKIVKPILKVVGKWAPRLAPIAGMIPGVGPVIAGYLVAAGTAAKLAEKYGVEIAELAVNDAGTGKKVKSTKIVGKPTQVLKYQQAMKAAALQAAKKPKDELKAGLKALKKLPPGKFPRESILGGKTILKKGSPEWKGALQALGLRAGAFKSLGKKKRARAMKAARKAFQEAAGFPTGSRFIKQGITSSRSTARPAVASRGVTRIAKAKRKVKRRRPAIMRSKVTRMARPMPTQAQIARRKRLGYPMLRRAA
jgi:hypothetical protein